MRILTGIVLIVLGFGLMFFRGCNHFEQEWEYENKIGNNWDLADAASTIEQKSAYMDQFVKSLENSGLQGMNSHLFYQTPISGFNQNLIALKSLQLRLKEIKNLDVNSFAYQTAIQQITDQEQGGARDMINVFESCYYKKNYYWYWDWRIIVGMLILEIVLVIFGGSIISND
jgi:hypothetical protein